jgi:serine protease
VHRGAGVTTKRRLPLPQLALALLVAAFAFVATTRIGPAFAHTLAGPPGAGELPPFLPDDTAGGGPGDWTRYQWNFTGRYGVDAPRAWANLIAAGAPGGAGVTVAVLDTGVAYANRKAFRRSPDLAASQFVPGWDFVDDDAYPLDENGHGTHVASTIAERTDNGYGLTGLAYGARIMPVRVLDGYGDGDAVRIARGVVWAVDHEAKVINLSFNFDRGISAAQIPQLLHALRYASEHGVLIVTAAGNDHVEGLPYPARSAHVLSVGATTEFGCVATYSSFGRDLDVVAPGGGTDAPIEGDPNCVSRRTGRDIDQITLAGSPSRFRRRGFIGASMAAPHVAALAALIVASGVLGEDPTPAEITARIRETARDLGSSGYDERYGWGLVDAAAATSP